MNNKQTLIVFGKGGVTRSECFVPLTEPLLCVLLRFHFHSPCLLTPLLLLDTLDAACLAKQLETYARLEDSFEHHKVIKAPKFLITTDKTQSNPSINCLIEE